MHKSDHICGRGGDARDVYVPPCVVDDDPVKQQDKAL